MSRTALSDLLGGSPDPKPTPTPAPAPAPVFSKPAPTPTALKLPSKPKRTPKPKVAPPAPDALERQKAQALIDLDLLRTKMHGYAQDCGRSPDPRNHAMGRLLHQLHCDLLPMIETLKK